MGKPSARDLAKVERLRARANRLLERGQAAESRARHLYEQANDVDDERYQLEVRLGLVPPPKPSASMAAATAIYKKLYAPGSVRP